LNLKIKKKREIRKRKRIKSYLGRGASIWPNNHFLLRSLNLNHTALLPFHVPGRTSHCRDGPTRRSLASANATHWLVGPFIRVTPSHTARAATTSRERLAGGLGFRGTTSRLRALKPRHHHPKHLTSSWRLELKRTGRHHPWELKRGKQGAVDTSFVARITDHPLRSKNFP
jgi:hypothetical protein